MAETSKLTETTIANARLEPQQKQEILWDSAVTGFGLRILPGGSKTFWFQYRPPGAGRSASARMVRIGPWPTTSLADARKAARGYAGTVAQGNPAANRQEERRRSGSMLRTLLAEDGQYERHLQRPASSPPRSS